MRSQYRSADATRAGASPAPAPPPGQAPRPGSAWITFPPRIFLRRRNRPAPSPGGRGPDRRDEIITEGMDLGEVRVLAVIVAPLHREEPHTVFTTVILVCLMDQT